MRRLYTGENLGIMQGLDSDIADLIYLDPPFNSNRDYGEFDDRWNPATFDTNIESEDILDLLDSINKLHSFSMMAYCAFMYERLLEMKRILKDSGSIYLHCDPTASHYLKVLMDSVFGKDNFRNDIIWQYGKSARGAKAIAKNFARNNDTILLYSKDKKQVKHNRISDYREWPTSALPSHIRYKDGIYFKTAPRGDYTDKSIERLRTEGRIYETKTGNIRIKYNLDCVNGMVREPILAGSVWDIPDIMHTSKTERMGYPTQKPVALLERIIKASSNFNDTVFDPFCGCGVTLICAEKFGRNWIGIDKNDNHELLEKLAINNFGELTFDYTHKVETND